jgi:hypothetical protein
MALAVVTVASGGLPVVEVTAYGLAVTEAANARGIPVTKVTGGKPGLPVTFVTESGQVVPPIVWAAFDPATVIDTALTNGNLTATHTTANANSGARVASAKSTGKYYFVMSCLAGHGSFDGMGLAKLTTTYNNIMLSGDSQIVVTRGGAININNVFTSKNIGGFNLATDVLGIAVDLTARLVWCCRNAGSWNADGTADPATGVAGLAFPGGTSLSPCVCFVGAGTAINDAYSANFGASAFSGAVPSGFTAGWPV